jgi:hypothetical protein
VERFFLGPDGLYGRGDVFGMAEKMQLPSLSFHFKHFPKRNGHSLDCVKHQDFLRRNDLPLAERSILFQTSGPQFSPG